MNTIILPQKQSRRYLVSTPETRHQLLHSKHHTHLHSSDLIPIPTKTKTRAHHHHLHHHTKGIKTVGVRETTSPITNSPPSIVDYNSLEAEALKAHNDLRAKHGAKPLSWSNELAQVAQNWSDKCKFPLLEKREKTKIEAGFSARIKIGVFEHGGGVQINAGENLAALSGTSSPISAGIALWSAEASSYDPTNPTFSHFTQMVWKASTHVGCSVSICNLAALKGERSNFYVCEYLEAGSESSIPSDEGELRLSIFTCVYFFRCSR